MRGITKLDKLHSDKRYGEVGSEWWLLVALTDETADVASSSD